MRSIVARIPFTEGIERDVYRDERGKYVRNGDDQRVYGAWILDREAIDDAPLIVEAEAIKAAPLIVEASADE